MDNPPFYRKTIPARNLHDREDFPAMLEKTGGKSQRYFHYITIIYIYASYYYYIPLSSLSLLLLSIKPIIITYYYYCIYIHWLVVSTPLIKISQWYPIYYGKIKFMFETTNQYIIILLSPLYRSSFRKMTPVLCRSAVLLLGEKP